MAQKLHGVSAPHSKRAHDLIDLQLIMANDIVELSIVAELCRQLFKYRKVYAWPPIIVKGEVWDRVYEEQKGSLPVGSDPLIPIAKAPRCKKATDSSSRGQC